MSPSAILFLPFFIVFGIGPVALILYLYKEIEEKSDYDAEQWDRARRPEYWAAIDAQEAQREAECKTKRKNRCSIKRKTKR